MAGTKRENVNIVGLTISDLWNNKLVEMYEQAKSEQQGCKKFIRKIENTDEYEVVNTDKYHELEGYLRALNEISEYVMQFSDKQ